MPDARIVLDLGGVGGSVGNVNGDGFPDLAVFGEGRVVIIRGSSDGFKPEELEVLEVSQPRDVEWVDVDRDGLDDIVVANFAASGGATWTDSYVFHAGPDGFSKDAMTALPTLGASAVSVETLDYDGDGWLDILVANHRRSGSTIDPAPHRHITESMLYWGGSDGFSSGQRWEVEAEGPSGLNLRDLGNSYDRGLYEDYVSSVFDIPEGVRPDRLDFMADTPHGTGVQFQVRMVGTMQDLASASWIGPDGPGSWYRISGAGLPEGSGAFLQYRARLTTPNGAATPYLERVEISFSNE